MPGNIYTGATDPNAIRAGAASAIVNGEAVDVAGDATYDATRFKREELVGQSGFQGTSAAHKVPFIAFTVRDAGNLSQAAFNDMVNVPVTLSLINGKTVYGDNMTCTETEEVNTTEGTFKVKFVGASVVEG